MKCEVIWNGKSFEFNDYDRAIKHAKSATYKEEKFDTALIIKRSNDGVELEGLRWIIFDMYELVNLNV